ncbi:MAG: TIGR04211 family SH3 domain-containing protein [bacterium]
MDHLYKKIIFFILFYFISISISLAAKNVFVVEKTKVNLRSGPGYEFKIINLLDSGEELVILETQEDWYKVRLKNEELEKKEGWILKALVKEEKPMAMQIAELKSSEENLTVQLDQLKSENIELVKSKLELEKRNQIQKDELDYLKAKYEKMANSYALKWVIVGASILLIGIIMGTIYEGMKHRHRPGLRL